MVENYEGKQFTFQINRIELSGDLFVSENSKSLVILVLGEKEDKFLDRFKGLKLDLNKKNIATLFLKGLLTSEEREVSANRLDESLLGDRLVSVTRFLRTYSETKDHRISYLSLSTIAGRIFRAASILIGEAESLILIGNGLQPLNFVFCKTPILNVVGGLDFRGIESNKLVLSKIDAPLKIIHSIQGSPSNFEEKEKWSLVSSAIQKWFSSPTTRMTDFTSEG